MEKFTVEYEKVVGREMEESNTYHLNELSEVKEYFEVVFSTINISGAYLESKWNKMIEDVLTKGFGIVNVGSGWNEEMTFRIIENYS